MFSKSTTSIVFISSIGAIQLKREPLLTWKPKAPSSHPTDYFVPNFGVDHEITATHEHSKAAETSLSHEWTPTKDDDGNWVVPKPENNFKIFENENYPAFDIWMQTD